MDKTGASLRRSFSVRDHPERFGPWVVERPLGGGGYGMVYLAADEKGRPAAVKTVRISSSEHLQGLRREVHTLARLRHPGVVRILGHGIDGEDPWYAMEFLEGVTLTRFLEDLGGAGRRSGDEGTAVTGPLDPDVTRRLDSVVSGAAVSDVQGEPLPRAAWPPFLEVVRRLCHALAYLHGEGVVHRDLKPDNVVVRPDGWPVLFDFGLASRLAEGRTRETLEEAGSVAGTAAYMAPEQCLGLRVDARADLYSLGCILYQALSGGSPFAARTMLAMLRQHVEATPRPIAERVPSIPEELAGLVDRLLGKDPADRTGYAADIARRLEPYAEPNELKGLPPGRTYLYRPTFAGRESVLEELADHFPARQESPAHALIGGESGVGKTRLLNELTTRCGPPEKVLLMGDCRPAGSARGGGVPLQPLLGPLQAVVDWCRERGAGEAERVFGRRGPVLAAYLPTIASLPGTGGPATPRGATAGGRPRARLRLLLRDAQAGREGGDGVARHRRSPMVGRPQP